MAGFFSWGEGKICGWSQCRNRSEEGSSKAMFSFQQESASSFGGCKLGCMCRSRFESAEEDFKEPCGGNLSPISTGPRLGHLEWGHCLFWRLFGTGPYQFDIERRRTSWQVDFCSQGGDIKPILDTERCWLTRHSWSSLSHIVWSLSTSCAQCACEEVRWFFAPACHKWTLGNQFLICFSVMFCTQRTNMFLQTWFCSQKVVWCFLHPT